MLNVQAKKSITGVGTERKVTSVAPKAPKLFEHKTTVDLGERETR